jgi:hypothetical protein
MQQLAARYTTAQAEIDLLKSTIREAAVSLFLCAIPPSCLSFSAPLFP